MSYKAQHEATIKVREMQEMTDKVIMKMITDEIKKFPNEKSKKSKAIGVD